MPDKKHPCYPNLRAEMTRYGVTTVDLAVTISVSTSAARRRLGRKTPFSDTEMRRIRDRYFPFAGLDYLFEGTPYVVTHIGKPL